MASAEDYKQFLIDPAQFAADWTNKVTSIVTAATASGIVAPANPRRVSLVIGCTSAVNFKVGLHNFDTDQSFLLIGANTSNSLFILTLAQHGGIVQADIWAASGSGIAIRINVFECIWNPLGN